MYTLKHLFAEEYPEEKSATEKNILLLEKIEQLKILSQELKL